MPLDEGIFQDQGFQFGFGDYGFHINCHSHQSCMTHCPVELNPTASIAGLKRRAALAALKGEL